VFKRPARSHILLHKVGPGVACADICRRSRSTLPVASAAHLKWGDARGDHVVGELVTQGVAEGGRVDFGSRSGNDIGDQLLALACEPA